MIKLFNFICPFPVAVVFLPPAVILLEHIGIQKNYVSSRLLLCLNIKTSGIKIRHKTPYGEKNLEIIKSGCYSAAGISSSYPLLQN